MTKKPRSASSRQKSGIPPGHRPAEAHHQQQRLVGGVPERLVAQLDPAGRPARPARRTTRSGASRRRRGPALTYPPDLYDWMSDQVAGEFCRSGDRDAWPEVRRSIPRGYRPWVGTPSPPSCARRVRRRRAAAAVAREAQRGHRGRPAGPAQRPRPAGAHQPRTPVAAAARPRSRSCWCRVHGRRRDPALLSRHLRGPGYRTYRSHDPRQRRLHDEGGARRSSGASSRSSSRRGGKVDARRAQPRRPDGPRGWPPSVPDLVDGIVTLGSPMLAPGAVHPSAGPRPRRCWSGCSAPAWARLMGDGLHLRASAPAPAGSEARAPLRPRGRRSPRCSPAATASSTGAAAWTRARTPSRCATSHLGMAFDPVVFDLVAEALAEQRSRSRELPSRRASDSRRPGQRQLRRVGGLAPRREQVIAAAGRARHQQVRSRSSSSARSRPDRRPVTLPVEQHGDQRAP